MVDSGKRDRAIKKITEGKTFFNEKTTFDEKNKGYLLFVDGIQDLLSYSRTETNQEIVKLIK